MALPLSEIKPELVLPVPTSKEDQLDNENKIGSNEQPESIQKQSNSMYNLLDFDLKILLLNYKNLEPIEKGRLIKYLRKLEKDEPVRIEKLIEFIDASLPFKFTRISKDAENKSYYNSDNQDHISSILSNEVIFDELQTPVQITVTDKSNVIIPEKNHNSVHNTSIPISFKRYGTILDVDTGDMVPSFKCGTIPKRKFEYNHETDSPPKRHLKLRENVKYLLDCNKITVPNLPYETLSNLVKYYNELSINEKDILIEYIAKLKEHSPVRFKALYDFLKNNHPENHILKTIVFYDIRERDSIGLILNDTTNLNTKTANFESDEHTLDAIAQNSIKNGEEFKNTRNVAAIVINKLKGIENES